MLYKLKNITHSYQDKVVLDFSSLVLNAGEMVGISGKNGSGKSTLLRLLAFLESPNTGEIIYGGEGVEEIAILLPEVCLLSRSVRANLEYMFKIRKRKVSESQINEALYLVGLEPSIFLKRAFWELSSGEKQRVGLAQRLLLRPRVLLLDEPTNSLDSEGLQAFSNAIWWANRELGALIVTISHDKKWLDANSQRRLKLHFGSLIAQNHTNLLSHNWSEAQNGDKFYDFGEGEVLVLPNSAHLDRREGIIIAQEHIWLHPNDGLSFQAQIIGIRLEPKDGRGVILEIRLGREILKKIISIDEVSHYRVFEKIEIGFDVEGILRMHQGG
ncbi:ATP-binding cassette domain-containing protein [Helicobacter pametensis]|uniref:ATP-binding cassette domain-containing protein n=1 Tax=Helicobacter pametensis TaxID=95149 RepID=UPI0004B0DA27|nr:ATP-binding cassette domain-containing protein [Helicobacter pametensis]